MHLTIVCGEQFVNQSVSSSWKRKKAYELQSNPDIVNSEWPVCILTYEIQSIAAIYDEIVRWCLSQIDIIARMLYSERLALCQEVVDGGLSHADELHM
jgi:hypothetical protein